MSYLPELRASLVRAADRAAAPAPRRRGWLGPAVGLAVTIAVAAVALVLIGRPGHGAPVGGHGPVVHLTVPPPPPQANPTSAQWTLIERARRTTVASDPACSPYASVPQISRGAPARSLTSVLGVLRLPASDDDRALLKLFIHAPRGIYQNAIRRARLVDGDGLYVVPIANVLGLKPVPERCMREEANALRQQTKGARRQTVLNAILAQQGFLRWQQYEARHPEGLCLAETDRNGGGSLGCGWGVGEIEEGMAGLGGSDSPGPSFFHGIVPDGVARVVLELPHRLGDVTAKVVNNVFVAPIARYVQAPARIVWLAADGAVIRTTRVP